MTKTRLTAVALAILATTAIAEDHIYPTDTWDGGDVEVTLRKNAVHDYTMTVTGRFTVWSQDGKPLKAFDLKWVGKDGAIFNRKRCEFVSKE
jgi:hypothetical protein